MSSIVIAGLGVVSPAGWGLLPFCESLAKGEPLSTKELSRPGVSRPLTIRPVPRAAHRPSFMTHARLRRASPIAQHAAGAAIEALGADISRVNQQPASLGVVLCVLSGGVNYSRRFYDETLKDPTAASPLVFPETVFNAPASHVAAILGTTGINYTLVGDQGTFLLGLALAADWLSSNQVDGCLVVGAEESDWLTADAFRRFERRIVLADGAGALYLKRRTTENAAIELAAITNSYSFSSRSARIRAAHAVRAELPGAGPHYVLCDGMQGLARLDAAESLAWNDWSAVRLSPKTILGEGLAASAAWQCVAAIDALQQGHYRAANVSVVGCNQQAIGAQFVNPNFNG